MNNSDSVIYKEKQRFFDKLYIKLLLLFLNLYNFYQAYLIYADTHLLSEVLSTFVLYIMPLITLLFYVIYLETQITQEAIYYRFYPFQLKFKRVDFKNILKIYVRTYQPLSEFGGWGIRYSLMGSGTAYSISGKYGIQIHFLNHGKLLIGTNQPVKVEKALKNLHLSQN